MAEHVLFALLNLFFFYLGFCYYRLFKRDEKRKRSLVICSWGMMAILLNTAYYLLTLDQQSLEFLGMVLIGVILMICVVLLQMKASVNQEKEKSDALLLQRQSAYYAKQYETISHYQEETRKQRHELKNFHICLEALAKRGDIEGILRYLNEQTEYSHSAKQFVQTGNLTVDAVLNYHLEIAEEAQIAVKTNLNIPTQMDIQPSILCGILGNVLDNAIEASMQIKPENRMLTISMHVEKRNLFIEITNCFDGYIQMNENRLFTRKDDAACHGFGLELVRQLVDGGIGNVEVSWENKIFTTGMILYHVI